ncbi:MAG: FHA domain-containing protein [Deltaproteobacteria bacterium]|nr:FHA domain-containing protein [Deltaproteobacteria bacterium]
MSELATLGGTYTYLNAYIDLIRQLDRGSFTKRVRAPLLIVEPKKKKKRASFAAGATKHASVDGTDPHGSTLPSRLLQQAHELIVHEIRRKVSEGSGRVMLGRAADCDVVIGDETVSMLQSVFLFDADGRCTIEDMETTNGTLLNGTPLAFGAPTGLKDGDSLIMGDTRLLFFYPQGLYDLMRALVSDQAG